MKIIINNERPKSWNEYYAGKHWSIRATEAERVHQLIQYMSKKGIFVGQVDIVMTVYFKNRPLDADNIASKFYIDGLKGRVIEDDNPKYVRSVKTVSLVDKENPRVEIELMEVES